MARRLSPAARRVKAEILEAFDRHLREPPKTFFRGVAYDQQGRAIVGPCPHWHRTAAQARACAGRLLKKAAKLVALEG